MNNKINLFDYFIYAILILIFISYFLGFYFREISNGAGHGDLELHIWPLLIDLQYNYLDTIENYSDYKEATFPFFHTLQYFFNPFIETVFEYTLSNTIFNLTILLVFFYYLSKKRVFGNKDTFKFLLPFLFLLSPWYRSTSYWGMTENLAILFFIPTCHYFNEFIFNKNNLKSNIFLTIFISLTIYSRQQYIYLVFSHLIILFLIDKNFKNIYLSILIYSVLSIPGLVTYYSWDVHKDFDNAMYAINQDIYTFKNILLNIPKLSSILFFYLIPILIINSKYIYKTLNKKLFLISFIIIYSVEFYLFQNLEYKTQGGGFIIKFYKIFLNENNYFLIFISSLFFSIIVSYIKKINKEFIIIICCLFLIIGSSTYIYQEWFDPLYIVIFYILLPKSLILKLNLNKFYASITLLIWQIMILTTSIIYYHFYLKLPLFYNF